MPRSFQMVHRAAFFLAAACASGYAWGGLSLHVLDACEPLQEVIGQLMHPPATARACRAPRNELERQYASRMARKGMALCLLSEPPVPFLASFSCVEAPGPRGANLNCFRPAVFALIKAYQAHYDEPQAKVEKAYLDAAAACPISTGDTARIPASMFPQSLAEVAAFEFGFVSVLRSGPNGPGAIVHGYAKTDPELPGDTPSALEFISFTTAAQSMAATGQTRHIGDWTLHVDDNATMSTDFDEVARKQHLAARLESATFEFKKSRGDRGDNDKSSMLRETNAAVIRLLRDKGFKRLPPAALEAQTGMSKSVLSKLAKGKGELEMLIYEKAPACGPGGVGAIIADVLRFAGTPGVRSDYGSIGVVLVAVGDCAHQTAINHYLTELLTESGGTVEEQLKTR